MAQSNPPRKSPILNLFGAVRETIAAARETSAASDAGLCVVCAENPVEPPAKLCERCSGDAADAAASVAQPVIDRVAGSLGEALANGVRDALRGRR